MRLFFIGYLVVEGEIGDGDKHQALLRKILPVHGENGIVIVISLAGHGKVETLVASAFHKPVIIKGIFPVGTAEITDLDIVISGFNKMKFVGIAVRVFPVPAYSVYSMQKAGKAFQGIQSGI